MNKLAGAFAALMVCTGAQSALAASAADTAKMLEDKPCTADPASHEVMLRPMIRTHTLPIIPRAYEAASAGTSVKLQVHILPDGTIGETQILDSSGNADIDNITAEYVKAHWRWYPPRQMSNCEPIDARTIVQTLY